MITRPMTVLFGGSFNPPHSGHREFVQALAQDARFSEVWVLPCADHAFGKSLAPFEHRMAMSKLAFADLGNHVTIRDDEEKLPGTNYTIDLINYLLPRYPDRSFALALGADNYAVRHKWKDFAEIEKLVEVIFYGRKGWTSENEELMVTTPFPEIASSEIRRMVSSGENISELVPPSVATYIQEHALYQD